MILALVLVAIAFAAGLAWALCALDIARYRERGYQLAIGALERRLGRCRELERDRFREISTLEANNRSLRRRLGDSGSVSKPRNSR